jgi:hypothetical protein
MPIVAAGRIMCSSRSTKVSHHEGSVNSRNGSEMPEAGSVPANTMSSISPSHCVGSE